MVTENNKHVFLGTAHVWFKFVKF